MATGYSVCVHIVYEHRAISCTGPRGAGRAKSVQRLRGDCTENVQSQCSCRAVTAASTQKSYGARAASVQRLRGDDAVTVAPPVPFFERAACRDCAMSPTTCLRATDLRFFKFL